MKRSWIGLAALLLSAVALGSMARMAQTADHKDAPALIGDPAGDINDVYAFVNPNDNNVVLAMTVNPFTPPGAKVFFSPEVLYQIKVDNTGDGKEDLVFQATFTAADPSQQVTLVGPIKPKNTGATNQLITDKHAPKIVGAADGTILTNGTGIKAFAGPRDDPFFFDFIWVGTHVGFLPGPPVERNPGISTFSGLNTTIIAVEVPPAMLKSTHSNSIHVWATTSRSTTTRRDARHGDRIGNSFVQLDRNGLPAINTALIPAARHDEYNRTAPADDRRVFRADVLNSLTGLNGDATYSAQIADALLPDVLTLDVTSTSGFPNGRRPQDDVIDAVLNIVSKGALTSDNVDANDVPFLADFPFFAPPHQPSEAIPPRN